MYAQLPYDMSINFHLASGNREYCGRRIEGIASNKDLPDVPLIVSNDIECQFIIAGLSSGDINFRLRKDSMV